MSMIVCVHLLPLSSKDQQRIQSLRNKCGSGEEGACTTI